MAFLILTFYLIFFAGFRVSPISSTICRYDIGKAEGEALSGIVTANSGKIGPAESGATAIEKHTLGGRIQETTDNTALEHV